MNAVVIGTLSGAGLASSLAYLTGDARHRTLETRDGRDIHETLDAFRTAADAANTARAIAHIAIGLAPHDQPDHDRLLRATRAVLEHPVVGMGNRPYFIVAHDDRHPHVHVEFPRRDLADGTLTSLTALPSLLWLATNDVAPAFGFAETGKGSPDRRREPRRARSVGVWHGERSRYAWLAEVVYPAIGHDLETAPSHAHVAELLGRYGLGYARSARGGVIVDHSGPRPAGVPASALSYALALPALEARLGTLPTYPPPHQPRTNPRAYANDHDGRRLPLGTDEERRDFASDHAVWRATWLPVRAAQEEEVRAAHRARLADLDANLALFRRARDRTATSHVESKLATSIIASFADAKRAESTRMWRDARAALKAQPYAVPPPSRLREWLEARDAVATQERELRGPLRPVDPPEQTRFEERIGLDSSAREWWDGPRRVAIDYGERIVVADPTIAADAFAIASARFDTVTVAGDQSFRDSVEAIARTRSTPIALAPPPRRIVTPPIPGSALLGPIRVAAAVAEHLGRPPVLDGILFDPQHPEEHPRVRRPSTAPAFLASGSDTLALRASAAARARLRANGVTPALENDDVFVIALPDATPNERAILERELQGLTEVAILDQFPAEPFVYGPREPCEYVRRRMANLRAQRSEPTFTERVDAIAAFFAALEPRTAATVPPPRVEPEPKPRPGRKRGGRAR